MQPTGIAPWEANTSRADAREAANAHNGRALKQQRAPTLVLANLLRLEHSRVENIFVGRLTGAALLAIGAASWTARADTLLHAHLGLLTGILVYNAMASIPLAYVGG